MNTIRVLHTSDTHLGYRQYGLSERERDIYDVFGEIIDTAIEERVDAVIHSGDFFDSVTPPPQAYYHAINHLRKLRDRSIPFIVVPGDHDMPKRRVLPPLLVLERLGLVTLIGLREPEVRKLSLKGSKIVVAGVHNIKGPGARQQLHQALLRLRRGDDSPAVLILHQSLREVAPEYEIELGELPRGYSYYAMGHIHLYKRFTLGESAVAYPGSPEALRRDEAEAQDRRYVLLVEIDKEKTIGLERIELKTTRPQPVYRHVYRSDEEFKSFLVDVRDKIARIEARGKKPLVHIVIEALPRGKKTRVYDLIERTLRSHVLSLRLQSSVIDTSLPKTVQEATASIDHYKILRDMLGSDDLAKLALRLIDVLGAESRQSAIEQAEEIISKHFGIEV